MKEPFINKPTITGTRVFLLLTIVLSLTTCKKFGKPHDLFFYSDIESAAAPMSLFLDGDYKGELPNLHTRMAPDNDTILTQGLHLTLKPGKYKLIGKDNQGNVRCEGTIKFSNTGGGGSSTRGGNGTSGSGKTTVVKLFF